MIDPNEASAGFVAEPFSHCRFCALDPQKIGGHVLCQAAKCMAWERADKTEVQFRKIEKRKGGK